MRKTAVSVKYRCLKNIEIVPDKMVYRYTLVTIPALVKPLLLR